MQKQLKLAQSFGVTTYFHDHTKENNFRQIVLSPNQLQKANFDFEDVSIDGPDGRNFKKVRVLT